MGKTRADISGVILAGGKSSRMGRNKAFLDVGGRRLIDITTGLFKEIFSEVILVTNTPEEYAGLLVTVVTDIFQDKGSIVGIYTGLYHSSNEHIFVASCDMPFLKRGLIEYIIDRRAGWDAVVPRLQDGYEPLHAVYSRNCLAPIRGMVEKGDMRIISFYPFVKVLELTEEELAPLNPPPSSFININTPDEYLAAISKSSK